MEDLFRYIDKRFSPDSVLCETEEYKAASMRFNYIVTMLEQNHPEDRELIFELFAARAVLETAVGKHMFRKGLSNKWKVRSKKTEKGK